MTGLLIRDCSIGGAGGYSVYCEGSVVVKVSRGGIEPPQGCLVIDANGGTLSPGFVDTHCHPFEYGRLKRSVDLRGASNVVAMRLRLAPWVQRAKPGDWVTGRGWDHEAFPGGVLPTKADIDDITPANPVALSRVCGHIALLNSRAIEELGLGARDAPEYERDGAGNLTGIVKEKALEDVFSRVPRSAERSSADLQSVEAEAARLGLTALHCILSPEGYREELEALAALHVAGSLSLRYRVYIPPEAMEYVEGSGLRGKLTGERVRINGVKIYTDGSLGARTAALREPYSDDSGNSGMLRYKDQELAEVVERVHSRGYQAVIHAIGDRAVEQAADALEPVTGSGNPQRHRVEHASLLPKDLRGRLAKQGVRASVQPLFITSDTWAVDRLGEERVRDLYPLRSMMADGVVASGGSDSPVESMSPILAMWAAMTRGGSVPGEALDLEEAFSLYTTNARSNGFDDASRGVVEGAPADFTLLDSETEGMHHALFRKVGILATVVDGSVVHSYGTA